MAAPSVAGVTTADVQTASNATSTTTSQAISLPTSTASGDLLVLFVVWRGASATIGVTTTGNAWTTRFSENMTANATTAVLYCYAGASEPASITVTTTVAGRVSLAVVRVTGGPASGDPFDVLGAAGASASATTHTAPDMTTTQVDTLMLSMLSSHNGGLGGITVDAAQRELAEVASSAATAATTLDVADETRAASGATGTRTFTLGVAGICSARSMAIAPAATGTNAPAESVPLTATANDAQSAVAPSITEAVLAAAAQAVTATVAGTVTNAAVTATAYDATVSTAAATSAVATVAAATGTAYDTGAAVAVLAEAAAIVAAALDASVTTAVDGAPGRMAVSDARAGMALTTTHVGSMAVSDARTGSMAVTAT